MPVRIITDSTADMPKAIKGKVEVIPLTVHFGQEEFLDGVTMTHEAFYQRLMETEGMPTTSQATPAAFTETFETVQAAGDSAVVITLSSKLSGTYQSACIAAAEYENIYVLDSQSVTIGSGILVARALELANKGLSAGEIFEILEKEKQDIRLVAMLDTLEYLKRGGRISKTVALAGSLLNIKPVIRLQDGEITVLGKARGYKQANALMGGEVQKAGGVDVSRPFLLGYTGLQDTLLQKYMQDSGQLWQQAPTEPAYTCVGSIVGTHVGPGAVAMAFFKGETE